MIVSESRKTNVDFQNNADLAKIRRLALDVLPLRFCEVIQRVANPKGLRGRR